MKKVMIIFFSLLVGIIIGWGGGTTLVYLRNNPGRMGMASSIVFAPHVIQHPQILSIPRLGITAKIEAVGLDSVKRMDVPKDTNNVGWYKLGYKPGEVGNAVIDGHVDSLTGPAVFYNLSQLEKGDSIIIQGDNKQLYFIVTAKETYQYDQFPVNKVFGTSSNPRLNLITCKGTFDRLKKNYSQRLVVYTQQKYEDRNIFQQYLSR